MKTFILMARECRRIFPAEAWGEGYKKARFGLLYKCLEHPYDMEI